ncbi:MAG: hypothetical protein ABUJ92_00120 [Desulfobacterales bacterium]
MIKYKASWKYSFTVEKVEVTRETECYVFVDCDGWAKKRKESKRADGYKYYDSFDEAKAALLERAEENAEFYRNELEATNGFIENIKGLREC